MQGYVNLNQNKNKGAAQLTGCGSGKKIVIRSSSAEILVDFTNSIYPPLVNKIGFNTYWNKVQETHITEIKRAREFSSPVAGGLVELVNLDPKAENGYADPSPPFFRERSGRVGVQLQNGYQQLRKSLAANKMIQFTQFCGTPFFENERPEFRDPGTNLFPMLHDYYLKATDEKIAKSTYQFRSGQDYKRGGNPSGPIGGNFYPLPSVAGMDTYAEVFARYVASSYNDSKLPTVVGLWQEPSHTVANKHTVSQRKNVSDFLLWHSKAARALKLQNPDLMVAGFHMNGPNHIDSSPEFDNMTDAQWALWQMQEQEKSIGSEIPLDIYALQVFDTLSLTEQIHNLRAYMKADRFDNVPLFYNRFIHILDDVDSRDAQVDVLFGTSKSMVDLLNATYPVRGA